MNATQHRLFTIDEMAARLNLHPDTLRKKSAGKFAEIPRVKLYGKVLFDWPTVAKRLGIDPQSPPPAASLPQAQDASPADRDPSKNAIAAGGSLSRGGDL